MIDPSSCRRPVTPRRLQESRPPSLCRWHRQPSYLELCLKRGIPDVSVRRTWDRAGFESVWPFSETVSKSGQSILSTVRDFGLHFDFASTDLVSPLPRGTLGLKFARIAQDPFETMCEHLLDVAEGFCVKPNDNRRVLGGVQGPVQPRLLIVGPDAGGQIRRFILPHYRINLRRVDRTHMSRSTPLFSSTALSGTVTTSEG